MYHNEDYDREVESGEESDGVMVLLGTEVYKMREEQKEKINNILVKVGISLEESTNDLVISEEMLQPKKVFKNNKNLFENEDLPERVLTGAKIKPRGIPEPKNNISNNLRERKSVKKSLTSNSNIKHKTKENGKINGKKPKNKENIETIRDNITLMKHAPTSSDMLIDDYIASMIDDSTINNFTNSCPIQNSDVIVPWLVSFFRVLARPIVKDLMNIRTLKKKADEQAKKRTRTRKTSDEKLKINKRILSLSEVQLFGLKDVLPEELYNNGNIMFKTDELPDKIYKDLEEYVNKCCDLNEKDPMHKTFIESRNERLLLQKIRNNENNITDSVQLPEINVNLSSNNKIFENDDFSESISSDGDGSSSSDPSLSDLHVQQDENNMIVENGVNKILNQYEDDDDEDVPMDYY